MNSNIIDSEFFDTPHCQSPGSTWQYRITKLKDRFKFNTTSQSGFTLVELIVVMVIIGALAAMLLVNFQNARIRSRDAVRKADLRNIKSGLQLYYNDNQLFPQSTSGRINGCDPNGTSTCNWGDPFIANDTQYINALPTDPINQGSQVYYYEYIDPDTYYLYVTLENESDQDIDASQARCGIDPVDPEYVAGRYLVCND